MSVLGGLAVMLQTDDFAIIDKPAGLSAHNDADSVQTRLGPDYHLVHRLDRETSGLVLVTRNGERQAGLQRALHEGVKEYLAVLRGTIEITPENTLEWPVWNTPISDRAESRDNPRGLKSDWQSAETRYFCVKSNPYFSLVRLRLGTGRQHQIRKHSALAGRPVVGDPRYGHPKDNARINGRYGFNRLALHAHQLNFRWQGRDFAVVSPMPPEFEALFSQS